MNSWNIAGAAAILRGRRLILYTPFKVIMVNTAAISGVTGSCCYVWTKFRPPPYKTGAQFNAISDTAFTVLR